MPSTSVGVGNVINAIMKTVSGKNQLSDDTKSFLNNVVGGLVVVTTFEMGPCGRATGAQGGQSGSSYEPPGQFVTISVPAIMLDRENVKAVLEQIAEPQMADSPAVSLKLKATPSDAENIAAIPVAAGAGGKAAPAPAAPAAPADPAPGKLYSGVPPIHEEQGICWKWVSTVADVNGPTEVTVDFELEFSTATEANASAKVKGHFKAEPKLLGNVGGGRFCPRVCRSDWAQGVAGIKFTIELSAQANVNIGPLKAALGIDANADIKITYNIGALEFQHWPPDGARSTLIPALQ